MKQLRDAKGRFLPKSESFDNQIEHIVNLKIWIKELRSGNYKQGKHLLRDVENYCCLGVACKINNKLDVVSSTVDRGIYIEGDWRDVSLPSNNFIMQTYGFSMDKAYKHEKLTHARTLYGMNDSGAMTFADIADVIEQNILNPKLEQLKKLVK